MNIRRAMETDIEGINHLLCQVLNVHHQGRPDIFKNDTKKYTDGELLQMITQEQLFYQV